MKRTKIICTIGPSSQNPETIRELIKEGMDVARLNFSHGSYEEQTNKFRMVRDAAKELGRSVAILQDTKGPEIRLRDFEGGKVELVAGQTFMSVFALIQRNMRFCQFFQCFLPGNHFV